MTDSIITARHVTKYYTGDNQSINLRHQATRLLHHAFKRRPVTPPPVPSDAIYALRDVSFSIRPGQTFGIVGENGAGKTTLLRLLGGITPPSSGHITVKGDFMALLALGAGFDAERTGRENIYLNAALYGFKQAFVRTLVPQILAFAELEAAADRAIKHYSSGMKSRLGFAIAVHLLPDIVMIDESLAVGDGRFRQRSMGKIKAICADNHTVIMISHVLEMVAELCDTVLWLHRGRVVQCGATADVLAAYQQFLQQGILPDDRPPATGSSAG